MEKVDSIEIQLTAWVKGESLHNSDRDECCPDFSCCNDYLAPVEERERFALAHKTGDEETVMNMLMMFLGASFASENVHFVSELDANNSVSLN